MSKQLHASAIKPEQGFCGSRASVAFPPFRGNKGSVRYYGGCCKTFLFIEVYDRPVYLSLIVTFYNTHHDL